MPFKGSQTHWRGASLRKRSKPKENCKNAIKAPEDATFGLASSDFVGFV
jgi:hypothetical protein